MTKISCEHKDGQKIIQYIRKQNKKGNFISGIQTPSWLALRKFHITWSKIECLNVQKIPSIIPTNWEKYKYLSLSAFISHVGHDTPS